MENSKSQTPKIDLANYLIEPEALKMIPESIARKYKIIPLFKIMDTLTIAIADVSNVLAIDEARRICGCDIQIVQAEEESIVLTIEQNYNVTETIDSIIRELGSLKADFADVKKIDAAKAQKISEEAPIIRMVNLIIFQALKDRASDIHIEPEEENVRVRYRIDGVLHNVLSFSREVNMAIACRIKVISKLNIVESRLPQDGHFEMRLGEKKIDLRVSTFPVTYGEKVEMRILDRSASFLSMDKLGLSAQLLPKFASMIKRPYGIILVTGPTGSGKSSTLYAALSAINSPDKNIVTLEDPREYILPGVNQAEINPAIGFTFASGLRTILRQDPNIIMVGEIRDGETAQIAIRAALTGHLVLTSLHTNEAAGAITRLIDMGIEPFLISSGVIGVMAQRLVRMICPNCKEQYDPGEDILHKLGANKDGHSVLYRGKGCLQCKQSGYKGRIGIFEIMLMDDELRDLAIKNRPMPEIKEAAKKNGMVSLVQDGYAKVLAGVTTFDEILRVTVDSE